MYATLDLWLLSLRSLPGEMDENDALRSKRCNEDAISLAPSTTESLVIVEGELADWGWRLNFNFNSSTLGRGFFLKGNCYGGNYTFFSARPVLSNLCVCLSKD